MYFAYFRLKLSAVGKVRSFPQKFSTRKKIKVKKMESERQGVVRPMGSRLKGWSKRWWKGWQGERSKWGKIRQNKRKMLRYAWVRPKQNANNWQKRRKLYIPGDNNEINNKNVCLTQTQIIIINETTKVTTNRRTEQRENEVIREILIEQRQQQKQQQCIE